MPSATASGSFRIGGERLLRATDVPGVGEVLGRLADEVRIDADDDGDYLHLALVGH